MHLTAGEIIPTRESQIRTGQMNIQKQGLKVIMGHKDIITKFLINVTDPVIVIDILNNM
jgi:hypothetical protein